MVVAILVMVIVVAITITTKVLIVEQRSAVSSS